MEKDPKDPKDPERVRDLLKFIWKRSQRSQRVRSVLALQKTHTKQSNFEKKQINLNNNDKHKKRHSKTREINE